MDLSHEAAELIRLLDNPADAVEPRRFPLDPLVAANPGLYAWWADDEARTVLGEPLGVVLPPLIYSGQAGATKWPSGKRSNATLASRIGRQHIGGNARSSTFRLTISALLTERLGLQASAGRLLPDSNAVVNAWMADHLRVAIAPYPDRDTLGVVEAEVVRVLDPPLNLGHCLPSEARARLTALRRELRQR